MLTVLTSGKAAPGVTTATWALALAWPRPLLVVDADPAGGDMAAGLLAGRVSAERGLLSWSAAARRGVTATAAAGLLPAHAVEVPERPGVWFVPGFTNATQGSSFTEQTWERLALTLAGSGSALGRDALVDLGRIVGTRAPWPVLRAADRVLVAARPSVRSVHASRDVLTRLRYELGDLSTVSALVTGDGPYRPGEVAAALEIPLGGCLPGERRAAAALSDGAAIQARALRGSPLLRAATALARTLTIAAGGVASDATADVGAAR